MSKELYLNKSYEELLKNVWQEIETYIEVHGRISQLIEV